MECTHAKSCELFAQFALNPALKIWQVHYCHSEKHTSCARYNLSLQGQTVPLNLLPNGKAVDTPRDSSAYGATALFNAILKDRSSMVESLIKNGVEINAKTPDGTTPLMAAAARGNINIIRQLLAKGADTNITNNASETAYQVAVRYGFGPVAEFLKTAGENADPAAVAVAANTITDQMRQPMTEASAQVLPIPAERKTSAPPVKAATHETCAYYLRIPAKFDRNLSMKIIGAFRELGIATEVVMQKKPVEGQNMSPIFIVTQPIQEHSLFRVFAKIEAMGPSVGTVTCMRMQEMPRADKVRRVS